VYIVVAKKIIIIGKIRKIEKDAVDG